jgi:hypothetical protein
MSGPIPALGKKVVVIHDVLVDKNDLFWDNKINSLMV